MKIHSLFKELYYLEELKNPDFNNTRHIWKNKRFIKKSNASKIEHILTQKYQYDYKYYSLDI